MSVHENVYEHRVTVFIKDKQQMDNRVNVGTLTQAIDFFNALERDSSLEIITIHCQKLTPNARKSKEK